ncbi:polynucleotide 5'-hydroxyl-kinase NOL9-like [Sinocyclocheilus rhinocerous]|uniref:Polynucleotide 5'-hydroxyl-kinase NOL9 n=1 Tax=Sinocyclocheilus rhinocerous TaxID=307959 RepID=A0A673KWS4_9TELE|nr:PREDICTED: polynucleotide 5'-hydroxyl-kinase NOL9-like [Sinocyclocheilus rhinocerous]XP_016404511.1 PREDICTED: polynucleotide 5'-hydroxyl-kinase NOL9-like [Sinocyclocheilus rhinocerous]
MTMKVHKVSPQSQNSTKRHGKNKWRKRIHRRDTSLLNTSRGTAKLAQQITKREKPALKQLKKLYTKPIPEDSCPEERREKATSVTFAHVHTNGGTELDDSSSSVDSQEWSEYANSVLKNGMESSTSPKTDQMEEDGLQFHAHFDHTHNRAVLVMKQGQVLCFRGKCLLTCLYGHVEVLGFTIEEGQQPYPLFSPPSHCPLTITALGNNPPSGKNKKEGLLEAKAIVRKYFSSEPSKKLMSEVDSDSCVVLLEPLDTPLTRFLTSFSELSEIFGLNSKELKSQAAVYSPVLSAVGVTALRGPCAQGLVLSRSYREAISSLLSAWAGEFVRCPIILACGGKSSGKSTFNRHLINSLLNHTASVEYLECDLGQTEFTPPGCLSLNTVTEPLLGPPFTHLRDPEHMVYYGQADCQADIDRYLESLKSLWRHVSGESPVIINTMGWIRGHGFQILVDLIRLFSVTHVVQLSFGNAPQCQLLTPDFFRTAHGWQTHPPTPPTLTEEPASHPSIRSHVFLSVQSEFEGAGTSGEMQHQRSNELRDLALLSYFSKLQSPEPGPIRPLHCFIPYQVPHSAVAIGLTHCEVAPNNILYAANASIVGLCCLSEKVMGRGGPVVLSQTPICQCVGLGVLRGVDMARGLYFLVTPVSPSVLRHVNCLLLGEITLPKILLTKQHGVEGDLPYVTTDYSFEVQGAGKLHIYKGLARPGFIKSNN